MAQFPRKPTRTLIITELPWRKFTWNHLNSVTESVICGASRLSNAGGAVLRRFLQLQWSSVTAENVSEILNNHQINSKRRFCQSLRGKEWKLLFFQKQKTENPKFKHLVRTLKKGIFRLLSLIFCFSKSDKLANFTVRPAHTFGHLWVKHSTFQEHCECTFCFKIAGISLSCRYWKSGLLACWIFNASFLHGMNCYPNNHTCNGCYVTLEVKLKIS